MNEDTTPIEQEDTPNEDANSEELEGGRTFRTVLLDRRRPKERRPYFMADIIQLKR